jgi:translation initiation factor IF-1
MSRNDVLRAEGRVTEPLPNWKFRVELPNGHRLMGFVVGKQREAVGQLAVGDKVNLEMSPYDLSKGRIVSKKD